MDTAFTQQIESLIQAGNFDEALARCHNALEDDETNSDLIALIERIETMKKESNRALVDATIKKAEPLWEQQKYTKLLQVYNKLFAIDPHHPQLETLIVKAKNALEGEHMQEQSSVAGTAEEKIKELLAAKNYAAVVQGCEELLDVDPLNTWAQKILKSTVELLIAQEVERLKTQFFPKEQFLDYLIALRELFTRFGQHQTLIQAMVDGDKQLQAAEQKKIDAEIEKGLTKVHEFITQEKLRDAMLYIKSLEHIDSDHKSLVAVKKDLEKRLDAIMDSDVVKRIQEIQTAIEADVAKHPEKYITI